MKSDLNVVTPSLMFLALLAPLATMAVPASMLFINCCKSFISISILPFVGMFGGLALSNLTRRRDTPNHKET